ncbi:MAG: TetR/AcrR family transcriptional regulator [Terriglobales bacterium]
MPKRKSARSFYYEPREPGRGRRGRTWRKLLAESVARLRKGRVPSIAEVAVGAGVSRATAYRYLPTRSKLVNAVIAEALAPVRTAVPQRGDARRRLHELLDRTYSRFAEYEPHMRAALQLALEHQSLEAAGLLEEERFKRGQRIEILATTLSPLKTRLSKKSYQRLMQALAVVYGIEAMIILKDICGANDRETEAVVRWMMDALVDASLSTRQQERSGAPRRRRRRAGPK